MTNNEFWKIVELTRIATRPKRKLTKLLKALSSRELIEFQVIFRKCLAEACQRELIIANYLVTRYVSDDEFEDFRAWLIFQGQERFYSTVRKPDSMIKWLTKRQAQHIDGVDYLLAAGDVYEQKYGDDFDDLAMSHKQFTFDPPLRFKSLPSDTLLKQKFPKLFKLFRA
jgi:hypothetical protein